MPIVAIFAAVFIAVSFIFGLGALFIIIQDKKDEKRFEEYKKNVMKKHYEDIERGEK